jgi:hypothetical protein
MEIALSEYLIKFHDVKESFFIRSGLTNDMFLTKVGFYKNQLGFKSSSVFSKIGISKNFIPLSEVFPSKKKFKMKISGAVDIGREEFFSTSSSLNDSFKNREKLLLEASLEEEEDFWENDKIKNKVLKKLKMKEYEDEIEEYDMGTETPFTYHKHDAIFHHKYSKEKYDNYFFLRKGKKTHFIYTSTLEQAWGIELFI